MKHTKLIAAALSAAVLLSAVPVTAFAADNGADNIYEDADCTITFHDVTCDFNRAASVYREELYDENGNTYREAHLKVRPDLSMEMGYSVYYKETGETVSYDNVESLLMRGMADIPEFDAEQPGDYDYSFTCKGEPCKIKIHLTQSEPYVTDLQIADCEISEKESLSEPGFTAVVHKNGEAVSVSNDELTDSREYASGLVIENRSSLPQLTPGVYTLKARYLDAEAEFRLTVKSRPKVTDFEPETEYDEYYHRGMVRFKSFTIDGSQVISAKDAAFFPLMGTGDRYYCTVDLLDAPKESAQAVIATARCTCAFGDDTPWAVGEHTLTVTLTTESSSVAPVTKSVHYRVNESAVDHIEVDDLTVSKSDIRREEDFGKTREYLDQKPGYRIYYKDGTVYDSRDERVGGGSAPLGDDNQIFIRFKVDNPDESTWNVGVYHAAATVSSRLHWDIPELETSYKVIVEADGTPAKADANADGAVNITDVTCVQLFAAESVELTPKQKAAADINGDGVVDVSDATLIQRQIAEMD